MKRIIAIAAAMFIFAGNISGAYAEDDKIYGERNWAASGIKLAVNGEEIAFSDQKPLLDADAGRTYVPVRFLAEALGAEVSWDDTHKVVIIRSYDIDGKDTKTIHCLKLGENKMVNVYDAGTGGAAAYYFPSDIYPIEVNGRTMLPFRYVAELLGVQVYYDPTTGTAHCIKRDYWTVNLDGLKFGYSVPPIFSTVIGDSFADELNKWYNDPENSCGAVLLHKTSDEVKPNYFDSALGDVTAWAGIDHCVHPEWWETDRQAKSPTAHKFTGNLDGESGCYEPFYRTYLPNVEIYKPTRWEWQEKYLKRGSYRENQVVYPGVREFNRRDYDESLQLYNELADDWGLYLDKEAIGLNNPKAGKGAYKIYIYDEKTYREISRDIIVNVWAKSNGHMQNMLIEGKAFGFSIVDGNAYFITFE